MATVDISESGLTVRLSRAEKIWALRGDIVIGHDQLVAVESIPAAIAAPRGLRSPGLGVPGVIKVGVWRRRGSKQFVAVRRHVPGVRIRLRNHRYDEVLLSIADDDLRARLLALA